MGSENIQPIRKTADLLTPHGGLDVKGGIQSREIAVLLGISIKDTDAMSAFRVRLTACVKKLHIPPTLGERGHRTYSPEQVAIIISVLKPPEKTPHKKDNSVHPQKSRPIHPTYSSKDSQSSQISQTPEKKPPSVNPEQRRKERTIQADLTTTILQHFNPKDEKMQDITDEPKIILSDILKKHKIALDRFFSIYNEEAKVNVLFIRLILDSINIARAVKRKDLFDEERSVRDWLNENYLQTKTKEIGEKNAIARLVVIISQHFGIPIADNQILPFIVDKPKRQEDQE